MITLFTFLIAVIPGLLICYFIIKADKYEKEPLTLLFLAFGVGVLIFFIAREVEGFFDHLFTPFIEGKNVDDADFDPSKHIGSLLYFAFVRTAFVEEFLKLGVLLLIPFNSKEFNEPMDGIVYAVMIGMGFAVTENIIYCLPSNDFTLALFRDFTAVPAHFVFGVILGYYVGLAKFNSQKKIKYISLGLFFSILVHGLYDIFLFQRFDDWLMILATFVLLGGLFFSRQFITQHQEDSPFRKATTSSDYAQGKTNPTNDLKVEDNEILSAVLFEMKTHQDEEE